VKAVVVGAGAAGGVIAKELSAAGLTVVLLERGKWYTANDHRKDGLRNQRTTVLGNAFGPGDEGNPGVLWDPKTGPRTRLPSDGDHQNDAACVDGDTLSYGVALYAPGFSHALNLWSAG
jgi:choline dehydrogenase-like flavoprotein